MLELQFIRDNQELVEKNAHNKGYKVDVPALLDTDLKLRELITKLENLQHSRNELAGNVKKGAPTSEEVEEGKRFKKQITELETKISKLRIEFNDLLLAIPNIALDDVPIGASEDENQVVKEWGTKIEFDFKPKTHWEIGELRDLIDKERAAKISGSRFAYIKGGLVQLQFAIIQFVISNLTDEKVIEELIKTNKLNLSAKPFVPVLPPVIVNTKAYEATGRLNAAEETYKLANDELWLNASAEHSLSNMYMNEILPEALLPIRYIGYSTSFRREAGSYGKDTDGILRLHQFDKLEMEVFATAETALSEHYLNIAIQEYLLQQLNLPYQVIMKCTADIGKINARGVDINTWMPGQGAYRETHTADYMGNYQARRLKTRVRRADDSIELVFTNDATAFALGRIMIAIIENFQTHDAHIIVPEVLRKFMGGREEI